ncbi:UNVERIFIED_CONTAM: hypothetical protein K2H54_042598 [Gekko kuhli]
MVELHRTIKSPKPGNHVISGEIYIRVLSYHLSYTIDSNPAVLLQTNMALLLWRVKAGEHHKCSRNDDGVISLPREVAFEDVSETFNPPQIVWEMLL